MVCVEKASKNRRRLVNQAKDANGKRDRAVYRLLVSKGFDKDDAVWVQKKLYFLISQAVCKFDRSKMLPEMKEARGCKKSTPFYEAMSNEEILCFIYVSSLTPEMLAVELNDGAKLKDIPGYVYDTVIDYDFDGDDEFQDFVKGESTKGKGFGELFNDEENEAKPLAASPVKVVAAVTGTSPITSSKRSVTRDEVKTSMVVVGPINAESKSVNAKTMVWAIIGADDEVSGERLSKTRPTFVCLSPELFGFAHSSFGVLYGAAQFIREGKSVEFKSEKLIVCNSGKQKNFVVVSSGQPGVDDRLREILKTASSYKPDSFAMGNTTKNCIRLSDVRPVSVLPPKLADINVIVANGVVELDTFVNSSKELLEECQFGLTLDELFESTVVIAADDNITDLVERAKCLATKRGDAEQELQSLDEKHQDLVNQASECKKLALAKRQEIEGLRDAHKELSDEAHAILANEMSG